MPYCLLLQFLEVQIKAPTEPPSESKVLTDKPLRPNVDNALEKQEAKYLTHIAAKSLVVYG